MGRPKPLLKVGGRPLLCVHVESFNGFADPIIVVVGAHADEVQKVLPKGVIVVENTAWAHTWPADSLSLALNSAGVTGSCWVTPVDSAPASPETLRRVLAACAPAVPENCSGEPGHPVLLDPSLVEAVKNQAPAGGIRTLLAGATRVPVDDDVAANFNDLTTFRQWRCGPKSGD